MKGERILRIVRAIDSAPHNRVVNNGGGGGLSAHWIAYLTGIPKSTVQRILRQMARDGMVIENEHEYHGFQGYRFKWQLTDEFRRKYELEKMKGYVW